MSSLVELRASGGLSNVVLVRRGFDITELQEALQKLAITNITVISVENDCTLQDPISDKGCCLVICDKLVWSLYKDYINKFPVEIFILMMKRPRSKVLWNKCYVDANVFDCVGFHVLRESQLDPNQIASVEEDILVRNGKVVARLADDGYTNVLLVGKRIVDCRQLWKVIFEMSNRHIRLWTKDQMIDLFNHPRPHEAFQNAEDLPFSGLSFKLIDESSLADIIVRHGGVVLQGPPTSCFLLCASRDLTAEEINTVRKVENWQVTGDWVRKAALTNQIGKLPSSSSFYRFPAPELCHSLYHHVFGVVDDDENDEFLIRINGYLKRINRTVASSVETASQRIDCLIRPVVCSFVEQTEVWDENLPLRNEACLLLMTYLSESSHECPRWHKPIYHTINPVMDALNDSRLALLISDEPLSVYITALVEAGGGTIIRLNELKDNGLCIWDGVVSLDLLLLDYCCLSSVQFVLGIKLTDFAETGQFEMELGQWQRPVQLSCAQISTAKSETEFSERLSPRPLSPANPISSPSVYPCTRMNTAYRMQLLFADLFNAVGFERVPVKYIQEINDGVVARRDNLPPIYALDRERWSLASQQGRADWLVCGILPWSAIHPHQTCLSMLESVVCDGLEKLAIKYASSSASLLGKDRIWVGNDGSGNNEILVRQQWPGFSQIKGVPFAIFGSIRELLDRRDQCMRASALCIPRAVFVCTHDHPCGFDPLEYADTCIWKSSPLSQVVSVPVLITCEGRGVHVYSVPILPDYKKSVPETSIVSKCLNDALLAYDKFVFSCSPSPAVLCEVHSAVQKIEQPGIQLLRLGPMKTDLNCCEEKCSKAAFNLIVPSK